MKWHIVALGDTADVTDSLRRFLLRSGIVDQLERLSPGSSFILKNIGKV